ncbi:MAG: DMT family transporter [Planctomycetaceae bacterium]|nr:DMT family transporter [Planctomycetaceae bacterium]
MSDKVSSIPAKAADSERWTGTIFTFLSTLLFGVSNVVMRYLTGPEYEIDQYWALFYKEAIGLALLLPWLTFRLMQGRYRFTSFRLVCLLVLAAVICQLIGAPLHVLGFAIIGLIITVPLVQSATLLGVAVLGYFIYGDSLSRKRKIAIAILIVAVTVLSIGKEMSAPTPSQGGSGVEAGLFLLVAIGTVIAGVAYAVYLVMLRHALRQNWKDENSAWLSFKVFHWVGYDYDKKTGEPPAEKLYSPFPVTLMMAIVFIVGVIIFAVFIISRQGVSGFYDVPYWSWQVILISGVCNMLAFFFQIQGLRMTSAVQASLVAVSQMVILSLVGFWFFREAINVVVMMGLGLTVYGILLSAKPERPRNP